MWWECNECGGHVEGSRTPMQCRECGTAGMVFVPIDGDDPIAGELDTESLRDAWLRAGLQRPRLEMSA